MSLYYYAGHGVQMRGKNYLIPIDAEIDNEASVTTESVDVGQLLNQLALAWARINVPNQFGQNARRELFFRPQRRGSEVIYSRRMKHRVTSFSDSVNLELKII